MNLYSIQTYLELAALFLGIVNGACLMYFYKRDKAKFSISAVHPDVYQWWFQLPDGEHEGSPTKYYGFIAYLGISNRGLRNAALNKWRLFIPRGKGGKRFKLRPQNLPEPQFRTEGFTKSIPVLGQAGSWHNGDMMVESGASISGMAYFIYQYYGHESWAPKILGDKIYGKVQVWNVFGQSTSKEIMFTKKDLSWIQESFPGILAYHEQAEQGAGRNAG